MLTIRAHGKRYGINDPGGLIGKALRHGNPYEAPVLEHIYQKSYEGTVLDVGASVGNHTLWLACICELTVHAFEPLDYDRLVANVDLNDAWKAISTYGIALGNGHNPKDLREAPKHVTGVPRTRASVAAAVSQLPTTRIDDIGFESVSMMKIDVEGMESQVLAGGLQTIHKFKPDLYVEAENDEAHDSVAEILEPLGYGHIATYGATPLEEWTCSQ